MTIELAEFFVFRTPLLPFHELSEWGRGMQVSAEADPATLEAALAEDRQRFRAKLRSVVERPIVREALFLASPSLDERLSMWFDQPESEQGQKIELTLVTYLTRMTCRSAPFGLFAGTSLGVSGEKTRLRIGSIETYKRHTRLDCDYLSNLANILSQAPTMSSQLLYSPNSSLYRLAGRYHYVKGTLSGPPGEQELTYSLAAVSSSEHLEATLERAANGARLETLADALVSPKISRNTAEKYVASLVSSQVLVSDLAPSITGPEPLFDLIDKLRQSAESGAVVAELERVRATLECIDSVNGASPTEYRRLARTLESSPAKPEIARLFQVDMFKPSPEATLCNTVREELVRGIDLLHRIGGIPSWDRLAQFRHAFESRYGDREMPLNEVLDQELGIGFESKATSLSPLLEGLALSAEISHPPASASPYSESTARESLLFHKIEEALRTGSIEIVLDEDDIEELEGNDALPLPDSGAVFAKLAAASEAALDAGDFRLWFEGVAGPSGAATLGRFCHGDQELARRVRQHLRDEEALRPHAIFAEVVHLPEGRVGNVLLRPTLRDYEITYLGRSGAPEDRQISVDDLLVSIRDERVILRSRRLGREIVPRLTSAHVYDSPWALVVYRFLGALQKQGVALGAQFVWGDALERSSFLPRVRVGRLVLSSARWVLPESTLESLGNATGATRYALVQELRRARNLPRWVAFKGGENELPFDLENMLSIDRFVALTKDQSSATLVEVFEPDALCASGPEGKFVHDLIVPFLNRQEEPDKTRTPSVSWLGQSKLKRSFPPGSEWIYVKLYTGTATSDRVLLSMANVVREAIASRSADSWFFIRYADPDPHLRLRISGEPSKLFGEVLPAVLRTAEEIASAGLIWKIQLDTYEREVDRYGGDEGVLLSESLFHADSESVLSILGAFQRLGPTDARWRLALRGTDMLLDDLQFDTEEKLALVRDFRDGVANFHVDVELERQLGQKFRQERRGLEAILDTSKDADSPLLGGIEALKARSLKLRPITARLHQAEGAGRLTRSVAQVAGDYLHMFANRLFRDAAQAQELVIYDLLARVYESKLARRKAKR